MGSQQWGSGIETVTCSSIKKLTAADVHAELSEYTVATQIAVGSTVRFAVLVLLPDASSVEDEKASASFTPGSDLEWLNNYIGETPARFSSATFGRASISFAVDEA